MPRATNAPATKRRRKRVIKAAKGYFGNKNSLYRYAKDAVQRARKYAYRDRRKKKSTMRQLWIVRLNAAVRAHDITYSRFIAGLNTANIEMDRKQLSELAIHDEAAFTAVVNQVKKAISEKAA